MVGTTVALRRTAWALLGVSLALIGGSVVLGVVSLVGRVPRPAESDPVASDVAFLLALLAFVLVGFLIVRQQPRNAIGWLLGIIGHLLGWLNLTYAFAAFAVGVDVETSRGVAMLMALTNWMWVPTIGLMAIFVVLLFPDGRLPSARWRWLPWTGVVVMTLLSLGVVLSPTSFDDTPLAGRANPLALELPNWVDAVEASVFMLFAGCMLASAAAAVGRYRRSRGVERLQMKWLVLAGASFSGFFGLMALVGFLPLVPESPALSALAQVTLPLGILAVPLAIGAAVLKHGLYEIDVVINKAVVYGTLAVFITVVYVAIVVGLGRLAGRSEEPNLALSVAATAVVAVAFQPVRARVQRFANRLVYGERATPYEVLSEFADRVGGSFDASELLPTMARTVAQGVGALRVEVWLRTAAGWLRESTWPDGAAEVSDGGDGTTLVGLGERVGELSGPRADRVTQVRHGGELLGALAVTKPAGESLTPAEGRLLDDVATQAGLVLRNVRLIEELRSSRERLVTAQDEERRRLERNLHDGAQQSLVTVALMITTTRARLGEDAGRTGTALDEAANQLRLAIEELRDLARGIHPVILTDRGLGPALQSLAERSPVPVAVNDRLEGRLPRNVEAALYYVAAEALTNVAKYAHATQVTVSVSCSDGRLLLEISDDGVGGADASRGSGLRGLVDRLSVVDGTLAVDSPPGRGTRLACGVPVAAPAPSPSPAAAPERSLAGSPR